MRWPGGATVAASPIVPIESIEVAHKPGDAHPSLLLGGLGQRPHPNVPLISQREYGHRIGVFRVIDKLIQAGLRPAVAIDALSASDINTLWSIVLSWA
jgi:allantoinase